jgi:putative Mg2+ transporter-C (MgtC) family protein
MSLDATELVLRLVVAAAAGAVLGIEREARARPAGTRTHALVALGACLFTVVGAHAFPGDNGAPDPTRVAAQVVSGIGFIGAGAILRTRASVRGLTTAATLWVAAAIGLAAGAGAYFAAVSTGVIVIVLLVLMRLARPLLRRGHLATLTVLYQRGHGTLGPLLREVEHRRVEVRSLRVDDDDPLAGDELRRVEVDVLAQEIHALDEVVAMLQTRAEVVSATWQQG